ncbi:Regucalcin [Armadillidium nasatum]|uniref:Regucalcin n=1 Tax=Armadillidium nasatum TaxID=96803 RepID=A0A5N5SKJ7_9CRUS|nr:Regucalcin [Armadillidium nasatum]
MQNAHIDDGGTETSVSFIIPVEGAKDTFVIGLRSSVALIKWSPTEPDNQIIKPIPLLALDSTQAQRVKFNDAKCDNKGRLYLDTMIHRIDAFDYSFETGVISKRRPVFDYKSHPEVKGIPDGMSIDENDNLWVACFDGFQVLNINPREGKLLRILDMPVRNPTSTCWGGPDYSTLFVTSAKLNSENDIEVYPETGKTFAVTGLGVKGLSPKKFKVNNISKYI